MTSFPNDRLFRGLLLVLLLVFVFQCGFFHVSCVDPGFHLQTGELIWQNRAIPSSNTFSFTIPEYQWMLHQWLPAFLFFLVHQQCGVAGLITFKATLGVLIFLIVWLSANNETGKSSYWPFWACTIGVMLARIRFFERPFMFSFILLALTFYLARRFSGNRRWEWFGMPVLMGIWANIHVGVICGFELLGAFAAGEWMEHWWNTFHRKKFGNRNGEKPDGSSRPTLLPLYQLPIGIILSLAAAILSVSLINPNGIKVLMAPVYFYLNPFWTASIEELHPPSGIYAKLLFSYMGILVLLQIIARKRLDLRMLFACIFFAWLASRTQRAILMFIIVSIPYLSYLLESTFPIRAKRFQRLQAWGLPLAWLILIKSVILADPTFHYGIGFYRPYYPTKIYDFIQDHVPRQNIYNDMMYGGSMLWWLYPEFRPFIDGRGEAYSMDFWQNVYTPVSEGRPIWRDVFRQYQVHGAIISNRRGKPVHRLALKLYNDPQWALVAFDDDTLFFLERIGTNNKLIAKYEYRVIWPGDWTLSIRKETAERAFKEAQQALAFVPDCVFAQTALARACMIKGDYDKALQHYKYLVDRKGAGANYWRDYGYCLYMTDKLAEAEKVFRYMLKNQMDQGFAYYMLHFLALRHGALSEARTYLNKALAIHPDNLSYLEASQNLNE